MSQKKPTSATITFFRSILAFYFLMLGSSPGFASTSVPLVENKCVAVFDTDIRLTNLQSANSQWSPFKSLNEIAQEKEGIERVLQKKYTLLTRINQELTKELGQRKESLGEINTNADLEVLVSEWLEQQKPRSGELPPGLERVLGQDKTVHDKARLLELLDSTNFEISSDSQLFAIIRLCNQFILDFSESSKIITALNSKITKSHLKITFLKSQKLRRLLNGRIIDNNSVTRSFRTYLPEINRAQTPEDRLLYKALRLVIVELEHINDLKEKLLGFDLEMKAKKLESEVIAKGIGLKKIKIANVPYADFNNEVAYAFLKIVDQLGLEYGELVKNPGVHNRPNAFIRDAYPLVLEHKSPDEVWKTLRQKKVTLYRKLGGTQADLNAIAENGMLSAFMRAGGKYDDLTGDVLRKGVDSFTGAHISDAQLKNSPMISSTTKADSDMAYGIARTYSENKGDPHTYSLTVPIYEVIVASKRSEDIKNFELLIWQRVSPDETKHLYEESPFEMVNSSDYAADMRQRTSLPISLIEPADP